MNVRKLLALVLPLLAGSALAQVTVSDAWVRATVPQQRATGAFMRLTSQQDARLVAAHSPVAGIVEVHEMSMENDVMKMRRMDALELPAGRPVELRPGGYHVMLIDLKQQMKEGAMVPLTLVVETSGGQTETIDVQAPVRPMNSAHGMHR